MSSVSGILAAEFELLRSELIERYEALGMKASGNWGDSLEVQVSENSAVLLAAPYSDQLEYGRKLGKQPPSAVIEQWIKDKGIASRIEGDISVSSLAFLIARKIAREGWNREQYGGTELISSVVTPERIQHIIDKASQQELEQFTTNITVQLNLSL